ncbi:MAG: hypothetical protein ACRBN8_02405 [Nannocystales bacterium]
MTVRTTKTYTVISLFTLASWLPGCEADGGGDEVFASDELVILSVPGEVLCNGSVDGVVREYDRIARLHVGDASIPTEKLVARVGSRAGEEFCDFGDSSLGGCAGYTENGTLTAVGQVDVISHELVHGIRRQFGYFGNRFIEEGLAEFDRAGAFGDFGAAPTTVDVDAQLESFGGDGSSYIGAMTFVAFLLDRHGEDAVREATRTQAYGDALTRAGLDDWFSTSFGEPLAETIAAFEAADAPALTQRAGPCALEVNDPAPPTTTSEVQCSTNGIGVISPSLGPDRLESLPECFTTPGGGASVTHQSSEDVVITVTSWACENGEPQNRAATILRAGEQAEVGPESCMFSISSSGPADGYLLDWALE